MQCRIVAHSISFLQLCFSCKYGVRNYVLIWSTNDCSLVSTAKDGTRYVDDRTVWEGTADLLYWCNSWIYY